MAHEHAVSRAGRLLREGRLVAFPTETVYGLGANALDPAAVQRIYAAKGRPSSSPLIIHVATIEAARSLTSGWPATAERLACRFWPGPLTLVLPKAPHVPDSVTAGLGSVGLRIPSHPLALALLREAGIPVAAPSANRFTQLSPTTAEHVRSGLGDQVDLVLDGGPTAVGIESTVVSLVDEQAVLLRPGMVTRAEIEAVIGPVTLVGEVDAAAHPAPGLHHKHYSPRTPLRLVAAGESWPAGRVATLRWAGVSAAEAAALLYGTLHRLDREGWDLIAVEQPPAGEEWAAIRDRLQRAAS